MWRGFPDQTSIARLADQPSVSLTSSEEAGKESVPVAEDPEFFFCCPGADGGGGGGRGGRRGRGRKGGGHCGMVMCGGVRLCGDEERGVDDGCGGSRCDVHV